MASVKEILSRQPPKILYHYTDQEGLLGIIGKKEIWASHTQYLNDQREFRHAIELVQDELSQMVQRADLRRGRLLKRCARGCTSMLGWKQSTSVFVRSLRRVTSSPNGELTVTESPSFQSGSLVPYCGRSLRVLR